MIRPGQESLAAVPAAVVEAERAQAREAASYLRAALEEAGLGELARLVDCAHPPFGGSFVRISALWPDEAWRLGQRLVGDNITAVSVANAGPARGRHARKER